MQVRKFSKGKIKCSVFFTALNLAASMLGSGGANNDNLSDTNAELYVLGVKYNTPTGM